MDLESAIDLLYDGPVAGFIKARDEQVAAAKKAGNLTLAAEIKALRRPSAGAWLVNLLVRRHGDDVDALLAMGDKLRAATRLDGDELRTLLAQRRDREAGLLDLARDLAAEYDVTATASVLAEVRACLEAGLADPDAVEVIRSGQLVKPLGYGGFADAMAAPAAASEKPAVANKSAVSTKPGIAKKPVVAEKQSPKRPAKPAKAVVAVAPRAVAPAKLRAARERLARAERHAANARTRSDAADERRRDARANADQTRDDVADLKRFLTNRQSDLKMAERNAAAAERAHADALRRTEQAESALIDTQNLLGDLS